LQAERPHAALFSVFDRTGAVELARDLAAFGTPIYATGGTRAHLAEHGIDARDVGDLTGFPALFGGRVKTLHPLIFGGILADRADPAHRSEAERFGVEGFSVVVVSLYPFEATAAKEGATQDEAIEQIDVGGVALIRAAAKNFAHVTVLIDPSQYAVVRESLPDGPDLATRRMLATQAFERTAEYDAAIARYLEAGLPASELPGSLALTLPLAKTLRYGENPQSRAAFYLARTDALPEQLWGKDLSYNNLLDLDATLRMLVRAPVPLEEARTPPPMRTRAAVVKHTIPCGVAERDDAVAAVRDALDADAISAYGGVVAIDGTVDGAAADEMARFFLEIVAAPAFTDDAIARLRKKKNVRIIRYPPALPERLAAELRVRSALGGVLAEDDDPAAPPESWRVRSRRGPTADEWRDLRFAWDVVRHVKSNGVVMVKDGVTCGICAGQTNRVSAVRIAGVRSARTAEARGMDAGGWACASDGFFPFADGLEAAVDAGCTAVIAPHGSIRDDEVIAAADARGIALVFSTYRYFLH
jgi:phosphoribosylaminoimidazolecarboxamide formyltransferase / IMP cyclohydrolase